MDEKEMKKLPPLPPSKKFDKKAFVKAAREFAKILEKEKAEKSA